MLLYGKGGGAWVGQSNSGITTTKSWFGPFTASSSSTNWGWTASVGVEWAFWGTWSARAEWDYVALNNQSIAVTNGGGYVHPTPSRLTTATSTWSPPA